VTTARLFVAGVVTALVFMVGKHVVPFLARLTENFALRGRVFLAGALFFFVARGLSLWLAARP
jgi:hypothetical protein